MEKLRKVSYHKRFSPSGTCYNQAISVNRKTIIELIDLYNKEVSDDFPNSKEYLNGNRSNIESFKRLSFSNDSNILFMTLSQRRFFNMYLGLELKDRNTCLLIK